MKSVLMIAYYFPPEGNAGTLRPLRYVRHLPSRGWQPTVITLNTDSFERYDPSLLSMVPSEIEVIRVGNPDPWQAFQARRARRMQKRIAEALPKTVAQIRSAHLRPARSLLRELVRTAEAWSYHPDIAMGWFRPAVKAGVKICSQIRPDVIWATAGPVSSFTIAQRVAYLAGVPYVLDFRDAWTITYNEFEERRPTWAKHLDWRNMYSFLQGAKSVIFRYETEAECYWRAYPGALEPSRIHIIPNGYEGKVERVTAVRGTRCNVLYTGTLPDYRYDTLLQALCSLKKSWREEAKQLHLQFIGEGTDSLGDKVADLGLDDLVTLSGPVSQAAVTRLSREADALLLLGRPPTMRGYEIFAAAKLFGYLKAGRPIIGVLPGDEAKKILLRVGVSTLADVDSVKDIVNVLRNLLHRWAEGQLESLIPNPDACREYSAEYQTESLIDALDGKPASPPFIPGRVDIPASLKETIQIRQQALRQEASAASHGGPSYST